MKSDVFSSNIGEKSAYNGRVHYSYIDVNRGYASVF